MINEAAMPQKEMVIAGKCELRARNLLKKPAVSAT
jgi:hypothetical protein